MRQTKIPFVTFWAFSTENWKKGQKRNCRAFQGLPFRSQHLKPKKFISQGAKLRILGEIDRFPKDIAKKSLEMIQRSKKNSQITVTFALNYGGRDEILRAVKKIVKQKVPVKKINEQVFASYLDTTGIPDPDLIIRTGGDKRLSGYLPWQSVYSELYFTNTLFPDFTPDKLKKALNNFSTRNRRFGGN